MKERARMETLQLLGSAAGLGFLAGIRLYATVLSLGLAIRLGWLTIPEAYPQLASLADTRVLLAAGVGFVLEFLADKIPWVDSLWDAIHTLIRPVGAALLAGTVFTAASQGTEIALMLLSGGVAFTGHASKAATRLVVNHSPEPFSNVALSLAEDVMVPAGLWLIFEHPLVVFVALTVFLLLFLWLSPKVFRLLRLELAAVRSAIGRLISGPTVGVRWVGETLPPFEILKPYLRQLPERHAELVQRKYELSEIPLAVRVAATKSIRRLRHSIGYLFLTQEEVVFVTRRAMRFRQHTIPLPSVRAVELRKGLLLDRLTINTSEREYRFDIFKS